MQESHPKFTVVDIFVYKVRGVHPKFTEMKRNSPETHKDQSFCKNSGQFTQKITKSGIFAKTCPEVKSKIALRSP